MKIEKHFGISVVIRTRDLEEGIRGLLRTLSLQTIKPSQLVVVDNYSSEEKLEGVEAILNEAKKILFKNNIIITLVPLLDRDFSHAYSTNLGLFNAENEFVCVTNGHSLPISQNWLENGLTHFGDPLVVGVSGYFHPLSSASVWEKFHSFLWATSKEATNANRKDHYFSTINGLLRKSRWREYPFDENLPKIVAESGRYGGEDYDWGLEMISRGYKIVVEPKFDVYHSHNECFSPFLSRRLAYRKLRGSLRRLGRPRESFTKVFNFENGAYEI